MASTSQLESSSISSILVDSSLLRRSTDDLEKLVAKVVLSPSSPEATFKNWGKSFISKPSRVFAPTTVEQCAAIVELARREGVQLRPIGRAHSPSDLPFTMGWAIRMEGVKGVISIDRAAPTVTALAGTYISDIHEALDSTEPRLAMCSVGSISEQTLGGLISTATHGTGIEFPVVSAYVERLSTLCPLKDGTQHLTCSRGELPELFNASLCGLGTTGLITAATVRVDKAFKLKQYSEEVPFETLFGAKTGHPATSGPSKNVDSIGKLVAANKKIETCRKEYLPAFRSSDPSQVHPLPLNANLQAEKLAKSDPEDDDVTRLAQQRLEQVVNSAQHVRLMWFPQAGMMTMLRANRTTERDTPAPSIPARIKASLLGHRLTEFLLYIARFNNQLTPTTVRWIHYLTHPSSPRNSQWSHQEISKVSATTEAPALPPKPQFIDDAAQKSRLQNVSGSTGDVAAAMQSFSPEPEHLSRVVSSVGEDRLAASSKGWWPGKGMPADSPVPQPLGDGHAIAWVVGRSDKIFNMDCLFPQYTDEWAIPFSRAAAAIRAMREWLDGEEANSNGERIHFPVEIRFTDADSIWLSHAQGRKTCYIGLVQYRPYNQPVRYRQLFAKFEALMRHYAGRPHWAKAHTCSPAELATLYPHWNDYLAARERFDPDQVFVNPYVERHLLGKVGNQVDSRVFKSRL